MAEWCNSFVKVPKLYGTVCLCLDSTRLNQLPKLTNVCYMTITDVSSGYHNLKHDEKLSYLTKYACQFGRYKFKRLPFGVAPVGDMFQQRINEIFRDLLNVYGIAGDILIVGYDADSRDHNLPFQVYQKTILWRNNIHRQSTSGSKEN